MFEEFNAKSRDEVLLEWDNRKKALEKAKSDEMDFRKYVVSRAFPNPTEGTNTIELENDYKLKAQIKFNYILSNDVKEVELALDDISKMGNEGAFLADRLVTWHASFLLTEYRMLCEPDATEIQKKIRKRIEQVLTITEAAPSLEIKAPKPKK